MEVIVAEEQKKDVGQKPDAPPLEGGVDYKRVPPPPSERRGYSEEAARLTSLVDHGDSGQPDAGSPSGQKDSSKTE